jgi:hypothetical protein
MNGQAPALMANLHTDDPERQTRNLNFDIDVMLRTNSSGRAWNRPGVRDGLFEIRVADRTCGICAQAPKRLP